MTPEDLEIVMSRTGHEPFRRLTSDDNPDRARREAYRRIVVRIREIGDAHIAGEPAPEPALPAYPPLIEQVGNALAAAARFVGSGGATVDQPEFDRRRAICEACPHRDPAQDRCRLCACYLAVKPWSKAEHCPDDPPRW